MGVQAKETEGVCQLRRLGLPGGLAWGRWERQALPHGDGVGGGARLHPSGSPPGKVTQGGGGRIWEVPKALEPSGLSEAPLCLIFIAVPRSAEIITAQFLPL